MITILKPHYWAPDPSGGRGVRDVQRRSGYERRQPLSFAGLVPQRTEIEKLESPEARRAFARGCELFGRRRWYLVLKGERITAVEDLRDMPGWELLAEVRLGALSVREGCGEA